MEKSSTKKRRRNKRLATVNPNAAGIDVGSQFHVVAVPGDRDEDPVRTFQSFTVSGHSAPSFQAACASAIVVSSGKQQDEGNGK